MSGDIASEYGGWRGSVRMACVKEVCWMNGEGETWTCRVWKDSAGSTLDDNESNCPACGTAGEEV